MNSSSGGPSSASSGVCRPTQHKDRKYTTPHDTTPHYTTLHHTTTLRYPMLPYPTPHYSTLHYTTPHCTALHSCGTFQLQIMFLPFAYAKAEATTVKHMLCGMVAHILELCNRQTPHRHWVAKQTWQNTHFTSHHTCVSCSATTVSQSVTIRQTKQLC